jgi:threonine dehydrogenase-like Zn-dependent dehydrogenase
MRAVCWHGVGEVRVERVPDPALLNPRDAIVRVTSTAICGSDLHLYDGYIPTMFRGDILGHEFMGEVVEVGPGVTNLALGDRVVVPFPIACGNCFFCERELFSLCENSNPNAPLAEKMWGHSPAGIFGYSHMLGGYAGGQAEYVRVPFADVGPLKVPSTLTDEQVLFLSDVLPTGYMAAENSGIHPGDTIAVWGCGPVGLFAIASAMLLGAGRVIAIDRSHARLRGRLRSCEAGNAAIDRATGRAAPGDPGVPQRRLGLGSRRVRRLRRQVAVRCRRQQGDHDQERSDARTALHAPTARSHRARRVRSLVHRFAPAEPRLGAARLRDVQEQGRGVHQGRAQALRQRVDLY